jgi:hypothetical protein
MSQILLPPSSQEPQPPAEAVPSHDAPPPPSYTAEPLKKPSRFWGIVKWPLHQLLKGIYLVASFINRHRIISLIALLAVAAMVTGGVLTYRALNPEHAQTTGSGTSGAGSVNIPDTPFTVVNGAQIPLSNGVVLWLHGTKTYNAQELWNGMSTDLKSAFQLQGSTENDLQQALDTFRTQGLKFDEYVVAGSFQFPDGAATYTVEVIAHDTTQRYILTWYFKADPTGQILSFQDITQA